MKGLIIFAIILVLVGGGIWVGLTKTLMSDTGLYILVASGDAGEGKVELNISVDLPFVFKESPRYDERGNALWDEWIEQHYDMRDEAGKAVPGFRIAHSRFVDERKIKNLPEFYLKYVLDKGRKYTLVNHPFLAKKSKYTYTFTAEPKPAERIQFPPVK
jgi:hypothetical protein